MTERWESRRASRRRQGCCLVFAAERDGMRVVGAALNCPNWFEEAADIMDYGFETYSMVEVLPEGAVLTEGKERFTLLSALRVPVREGRRRIRRLKAMKEGNASGLS